MGPRKDIKIVTRIYLNNGKLVIEDESLNVGEVNNSNEVLEAVKESTKNLKGGKLDIKYIDTGRQIELVNKYEIQLISLDGTQTAPFTQKQLDALKVRFPNNVFAAPELNTNVNNDNAFVAPTEPKVETKRTSSVESPLKSAEEVEAPEAAMSSAQRKYEKRRDVVSIDQDEIKRLQTLAYAPNPEFTKSDDEIFAKIIHEKLDVLNLMDIANYISKRGILNIKGLTELEKAELLIDIVYSSNENVKKTLHPDTLDHVARLAKNDARAAELLLLTHFGKNISNKDRVNIITQWKNDSQFVATIAEKPARIANLYGNDNVINYTLKQLEGTWFAGGTKTMLGDLINKHQQRSLHDTYLDFQERLLKWLTIKQDNDLMGIMANIASNYETTMDKLKDSGVEAQNATAVTSLIQLRDIALEALKDAEQSPHEDIYLKQIESEINQTLKPFVVVDRPVAPVPQGKK